MANEKGPNIKKKQTCKNCEGKGLLEKGGGCEVPTLKGTGRGKQPAGDSVRSVLMPNAKGCPWRPLRQVGDGLIRCRRYTVFSLPSPLLGLSFSDFARSPP